MIRKLLYLILFILNFAAGLSCSGINLSQRIRPAEGDWTMAGGNAKHENVSPFVLEPPLEKKWVFDIDAGIGYSAVSVSDAVVFVNSLAGDLYTFDISTGLKLGRVTFLGKESNSNPLLIGNNVILAYAGERNNSLASYDVDNGQTNWKIDLGYLQTSPVLKDGFVYIGSLNGNFYKVDAVTDSIWWKYDTKSQIHSTCAIDDGKAVFGNDKGELICLSLSEGSLIWKFTADAPIFATPLINRGKVFFGSYDSAYYCVDLEKGTALWKKNMSTKIMGGSSIYYSSDVIFGGIDGVLYSLKADDGNVNWKFPTKGVITASPLCSGSNIYFTSYDFNVYCLEGKQGKELWKYELEGKSKTSPVIWKDYLIVAADKSVSCFSKTPGIK